jgi:predicted TPR repeat methyltransferase
MSHIDARQIAASYLPNRHLYWYCRCKLATDPLYDAVRDALRDASAPLLDVGCGIGLLAQCLRSAGFAAPYIGVDLDAAKLEAARRAAIRRGLQQIEFQHCDLTADFPAHRGSVALLDVLQYLEPGAQRSLLAHAARCLTADGLLVFRGGLDDGSWRAAVTRTADRFGHAVRWMRAPFKAQLEPNELAATLRGVGLSAEFRPAWGRMPFNNWLIVARRG